MSAEALRRELKERYPEFMASLTPIELDYARVPPALNDFGPYAEVWGLGDDWGRETLLDRTPEAAQRELVAVAKRIDPLLDEWLAGPEAYLRPSPEYVAFSAMRMAADLMGVRLRRRDRLTP